MKQRVSVVIPVFQRATQLRNALQSVLHQSLAPFEVIVADDGSTPPAKHVVNEFKNSLPIHCLTLDHSGRPSVPRNAAIRHCTGDWVSFLDSDDSWDRDRLHQLSPYLNEEVDVIHHPLRVVSSAGDCGRWPAWSSRRGSHFANRTPIEHLFAVGNTVALSASVVRRTVLLDCNGFDEAFPCEEDYDLWLRLALAGSRFYYVDSLLGTYELGSCNLSHNSMRGSEARRLLRMRYENAVAATLWHRMSIRLSYLDALALLSQKDVAAGLRVGPSMFEAPLYWLRLRQKAVFDALMSMRRTADT